MDLTVSNPTPGAPSPNNDSMVREYRKGNWTLEETMVLIEAKKMDDQRRLKRVGESSDRGKPTELRWKWVEDYCWKNACLRSQNQCNDKWDNLMRDFKKVREYEKKVIGEDKSYWRLDKNERKHSNLPSNMVPQIYEALVDAVDRKAQWTPPLLSPGSSNVTTLQLPEKSSLGILGQQPAVMPIQMVHQYSVPQAVPVLPPPAQTQTTAPEPEPSVPPVDSGSSEEEEEEEYRESRGKRQRREGDGEVGLAMAISRSGRMIAEAMERRVEREERRHREVVIVQQRRLEIEELKADIKRQGIHGLVDAINNLANSIQALADHHHHPAPPPPQPHSK